MQRASITATTNCCIEHQTYRPLGSSIKDEIHVETIFAVDEKERASAAQ